MSLNKVILIGRLGRDPEVRYMPNGDAVCNFSVATNESWKDKNGQKQERTEFHNIVLYRRLAEIAGQYLKKGSLIYLEGKIQSRKYTDKQGVERTAYDIVCSEMKMLDSRNSQQQDNWDNGGSQNYAPAPQQDYAPPPQAAAYSEPPAAPQQRSRPASPPPAPVDDIDDDIPF